MLFTGIPASVIYNTDTLRTTSYEEVNKLELNVLRSKKPLEFTIISDTLRKDYSITSKVSSAYFYNILTPYFLGFIWDHSNPKKYTYQNLLIFDDSLNLENELVTNSEKKIQKEHLQAYNKLKRMNNHKKEDIYLNFSFPYIYPSHYTISTFSGRRKSGNSILGLALGLDYYYKDNRFFNLSGNLSLGGDIVLGCGGTDFEDEEIFDVSSLAFTHNHRYNKLSFGYGLSYNYIGYRDTKYTFPQSDQIEENRYYSVYNNCFYEENTRKNRYSTLGLAFNGLFYLSNWFSAGIIYKPAFINLNPSANNRWIYEHQITIDFSFKIRLKKGK